MIQIAIVEDEKETHAQLAAMVRSIAASHAEEVQIASYYTGDSLLTEDVTRFDLVLMDIQMPGTDGMTAARAFRKRNERAALIFVTSMAQYALEGYRVEAFDFLVKPVQQEMLESCLLRALRRTGRDESASITVKSGVCQRRIPVRDIALAEAQGRHVTLQAGGEVIPCAGTLSALESTLVPHGFFRCHSAFLVSLSCVERIDGSDAIVAGTRVPVSKHRRKAFLSALAGYWGDTL